MSMDMREIYRLWQSPEEAETAFEKVKSGEWDRARFLAWAEKVTDYERLTHDYE